MSAEDVLRAQQREITGTSRAELNGKLVYIVGNPGGGRLTVKLVDVPHTEYSLKLENLKELGWGSTLKQAVRRLDASELRQNAAALWAKPSTKLCLGVLLLAVFSSRRGTTAPSSRATSRPYRSAYRPPPHISEAYALGFADGYKNREFGASFSDDDEDHSDLVAATLKDLPPESQGIRDE